MMLFDLSLVGKIEPSPKPKSFLSLMLTRVHIARPRTMLTKILAVYVDLIPEHSRRIGSAVSNFLAYH
jgi:hypothetical protein